MGAAGDMEHDAPDAVTACERSCEAIRDLSATL